MPHAEGTFSEWVTITNKVWTMAKDTGVLCLRKVHKDVSILIVFVNGSYLCIYLNVYVSCGWGGCPVHRRSEDHSVELVLSLHS